MYAVAEIDNSKGVALTSLRHFLLLCFEMVHHSICCVVNCGNNGINSRCIFYRFPTLPWKLEQRNQWIAAVKRINADGTPWSPRPHDRICSEHFIGGRKSDAQASPSYVPTIFPAIYRRKPVKCVSEAAGSSSGTPLPEPGYPSKLLQGSTAKLEDPLATSPPHTDTTPQCCFCAEYSKDCVDMTDKDRPYLTGNKTALTISDLSVEVDFNALPKTVCRACDNKLLEMFKFVKQVKVAQDSLNNVRDYVIEVDTVVKTECESPTPDNDIDSKYDIVDSLTVTDTVVVKPNKPITIIKHKRKRVEGEKTQKKPKVTKDVESEEAEFIIIEIKEEKTELAEMVDTNETENDDTEMDTKPSELELQTLLKLMK